jgi:GMP synthase (glutamine-hydrolysing)
LKILILDNLSPFTINIRSCLGKLGVQFDCIKYYELSGLSGIGEYDKIILSGRKKNKSEINAINSKVVRMCYDSDKHLLGICYGAEIIALTFGGTLRKSGHFQGINSINIFVSSKIVPKIGSYQYYESHHYLISKLPKEFICIGSSGGSQYEAFCHKTKYIFGTQFHPEKSGSEGLLLFQNFLNA